MLKRLVGVDTQSFPGVQDARAHLRTPSGKAAEIGLVPELFWGGDVPLLPWLPLGRLL